LDGEAGQTEAGDASFLVQGDIRYSANLGAPRGLNRSALKLCKPQPTRWLRCLVSFIDRGRLFCQNDVYSEESDIRSLNEERGGPEESLSPEVDPDDGGQIVVEVEVFDLAQLAAIRDTEHRITDQTFSHSHGIFLLELEADYDCLFHVAARQVQRAPGSLVASSTISGD
jgi:hypothetical protein